MQLHSVIVQIYYLQFSIEDSIFNLKLKDDVMKDKNVVKSNCKNEILFECRDDC